MSDIVRSTLSKRAVDIQVRRYVGMLECDVVISSQGREIVVTCPDYKRALRWAEMERKSYKIAPASPAAVTGLSTA